MKTSEKIRLEHGIAENAVIFSYKENRYIKITELLEFHNQCIFENLNKHEKNLADKYSEYTLRDIFLILESYEEMEKTFKISNKPEDDLNKQQ